MIKRLIVALVWVLVSSSFNFSKATSIDTIQGVYVVDKESLIESLFAESGAATESTMKSIKAQTKEERVSIALIEYLLSAELNIKGDSINGIISFMGETLWIKSLIIERNDSLLVKGNQYEGCLIPIEKGLLFRISGSKLNLKFLKTDRKELSFTAKEAIQKEREKEEFEQNLGKWQKGNYIDEFGDEIKDEYAYVWIEGTKQNSTSTGKTVYIMAYVKNERLNFQFYDSDMGSKESLPDDNFGIMKLKFSDGTIKSEKIYFTNDAVFESGEKAVLFNYISENSDLVKVLIDLNTVESYYSDKYIFSIKKSNLDTIRNEINK
jgi:hypothetical protein